MLSHITSRSAPQIFRVNSGALRVTDPCYDLEVRCSGQIDNVANGQWLAHVGYYKDEIDMTSCQKWLGKLQAQYDKSDVITKAFMQRELDRLKNECEGYIGRVAYIHVCHESVAAEADNPDLFSYEPSNDFEVGVDSGQAGIFDLAEYAKALSDKEADSQNREERGSQFSQFYQQVCYLTSKEASFGVLPFGAVSSSGYGDGGYRCYVLKDAAGTPEEKIVAALILFIGDQTDEDDCDD